MEYPWKRRRSQRPRIDQVDHYQDETFNYYGYNKKKIQFPLYRNDGMAQKLHDQLTNNLRYQISYRHVFNLEETCSHGNSFLEDDDSLVKVADHVTIYNENREETVAMSIYARKSDGDCHCQVQPDTTEIRDLCISNICSFEICQWSSIQCTSRSSKGTA